MQPTHPQTLACDSPHGAQLPDGAHPEIRTPLGRSSKAQQDRYLATIARHECVPVRELWLEKALAQGWTAVALLGARAVAAEVLAAVPGASVLHIYLDGGLVLVDVYDAAGSSLAGVVPAAEWGRLVQVARICLPTGADQLIAAGKAERVSVSDMMIPLDQNFQPRNPF